MIGLIALAAALAVEGQTSRGRAQELQGRLGLRRRAAPTGTLARLMWVEKTYGWRVRQGVEIFLIASGEAARVSARLTAMAGHVSIDFAEGWSTDPLRIMRGPSSEVYMSRTSLYGPFGAAHGWIDRGLGDPRVRFAIPAVGVRTSLDFFIPWVARSLAWLLAPGRSVEEVDAFLGDLADAFSLSTGSALLGDGKRLVDPEQLVFRFVSEVNRQLREEHVYDYLAAEPPANLVSMTFWQLVEAADEWHARFVDSEGYRTPARRGVAAVVFDDGARIERLVTPAQLEQEGESMGHCVGGYWPSVRDNRSLIFSYRDADGLPHATAEVEPHPFRIVQLVGPRNSEVGSKTVRDRMNLFLLGILQCESEDVEAHNEAGELSSVVPDEVLWALDISREEGGPEKGSGYYDPLIQLREATVQILHSRDLIESLNEQSFEIYNLSDEEWPAYRARVLGDTYDDDDLEDLYPTKESYDELLMQVELPEAQREHAEGCDVQSDAFDSLLGSGFGIRPGSSSSYSFRDYDLKELYDPEGEELACVSLTYSDNMTPTIRAHFEGDEFFYPYRPGSGGFEAETPAHGYMESPRVITLSQYKAGEEARKKRLEDLADTLDVRHDRELLVGPLYDLILAANRSGVGIDPDMARLIRTR